MGGLFIIDISRKIFNPDCIADISQLGAWMISNSKRLHPSLTGHTCAAEMNIPNIGKNTNWPKRNTLDSNSLGLCTSLILWMCLNMSLKNLPFRRKHGCHCTQSKSDLCESGSHRRVCRPTTLH